MTSNVKKAINRLIDRGEWVDAGQTTVTITSSHAKATVIQAAMRELTAFFKELTRTAEQLGIAERIALIAKRAYRKILPILWPLPQQKLLPAAG